MEGQAVTTNPLLIMAINMSIVFFVLIALGIQIFFKKNAQMRTKLLNMDTYKEPYC